MGVSPNNSMVVGCCFFMLLIGVLATFYPWLHNKSCFMWEEGTGTTSSPNKVYIARLFFCKFFKKKFSAILKTIFHIIEFAFCGILKLETQKKTH
jgi:hypothetical protein